MKELIQQQIDQLREAGCGKNDYYADQLQAMVDSPKHTVIVEPGLDDDDAWWVRVTLVDDGHNVGTHSYWIDSVPILWGYCKNSGKCQPLVKSLEDAYNDRITNLKNQAGL